MSIHTKDAETFLTAFTNIVVDSLASGKRIRVAGGGVVDVRDVAAHEARKHGDGSLASKH